MAINVSVGNNKVTVNEGDRGEPGAPTSAAGAGFAERLKQTLRDAAGKVAVGAKAAVASGVSSGSGVGVQTRSVNGKTHVVITMGDKTLERDYDEAVKVSVSGQNPSVVTITDAGGKVIEVTDF
ncbi:MAG TPA: hypothetical protein VGP72_24715 [Planctomycetota bacterium]|jgi:hypothetical protein